MLQFLFYIYVVSAVGILLIGLFLWWKGDKATVGDALGCLVLAIFPLFNTLILYQAGIEWLERSNFLDIEITRKVKK